MERFEDTYVNTSVILRPARVAILFRSGEHWRGWARLAITVAGKYWGGAGFILVPFDKDGTVAPEILDVVAAYDPDHVVTVPLRVTDVERVAPGFISLRDETGRRLVGEDERREYLARPDVVDIPQRDAVAVQARTSVVAVCTPLRNHYGDSDDDQHERVVQLDFDVRPNSGLLVPAVREVTDSIVLAGSEAWAGDASLSLAIRSGILPFAREDKSQSDRTEPDQAQMVALLFDFERSAKDASDELVGRMNVGGPPTDEEPRFWFDEKQSGLISMRQGLASEGGAIVVGDSAEDFALAYAYERLLGRGIWLSSEMLRDDNLARTLRSGLSSLAMRVQGNALRLTLTSTSIHDDSLREITNVLNVETVNSSPFVNEPSIEPARNVALPDGVEIGVPVLKRGLVQLAVSEPFETTISVPVMGSQDGTVAMRSPLPTPMPALPIKQKLEYAKPYWYVGVTLPDVSMPTGRGIRQDFVQRDSTRYSNNAVRSSREGFSFHSQAGGLVPAGSAMDSLLLKPRLKVLGMQPWVQAMVASAGLEAKPSLPGMHAQLISRRLGGRQALITMVSGPFHPALQQFASSDRNKKAKRTDEVFPLRDGVALGYDRYPSFQALCRALPRIQSSEVRGWVDHLAQADLLRRGFILDCADCTRPSFVGIDQMGQRYECLRCSAVNELTATRWKSDSNEPPWFYDLHASFRELMSTHGDVGLFAARRLQQGSWQYSDTSEIEFNMTGNRTTIAEIDLIAHVNGEVILLEAKSNGKLGNSTREARSSAKKKIDIAVALRADKVIIATSEPRMAGPALQMLKEAAISAGARNLQVEEMVGLGPELVDWGATYEI